MTLKSWIFYSHNVLKLLKVLFLGHTCTKELRNRNQIGTLPTQAKYGPINVNWNTLAFPGSTWLSIYALLGAQSDHKLIWYLALPGLTAPGVTWLYRGLYYFQKFSFFYKAWYWRLEFFIRRWSFFFYIRGVVFYEKFFFNKRSAISLNSMQWFSVLQEPFHQIWLILYKGLK